MANELWIVLTRLAFRNLSPSLCSKRMAYRSICADISAIKFTANGASATSGIAITGDPGAKAKYTFSVTLTAAANETIEARTQQIIATAAGGQKATVTLNQTAGDPFIEVTPIEIDVPQDGSAVQVTVDTNTTFTVTPKS